MEVSLGMLIVGSLYWDDQPHRSQWRHERLDLEAPRGVLAPIRYGRRSSKRGNSYTMVFSETLARDEVKLGTAIFVPCKRLVRTVEDLVAEAEILWTAESNSGASNGRISADWGCVGLAVNPAHPIPDDLRRGWRTRVSLEQCFGELDRAEDEKAIVEGSGVLNIPWPKCTDGSHLEVNALLATATNPTLVDGRYPSTQEIADAWNTDAGSNYVQYFWKNREHDITTFQDDKIESYLNDGRPVSRPLDIRS